MSKRTRKHNRKGRKTRKQRVVKMVGCSKKMTCPRCGANCYCKPVCKCPKGCPGNCYLNRSMKKYKGGSGCGSCGCPIAPLSWNQMNKYGGKNFSQANVMQGKPILGIAQNGGNTFYKPSSPMPGPFTGQSWGAPVDKWPGVDGVSANRNYLSDYGSVIKTDPALQMQLDDSKVGGYTYKNKKTSSSSLSGGGFLPQDLTNLGRDFSFNMKSAYNALNGYKAPVNPLPYKDQLNNSLSGKLIV